MEHLIKEAENRKADAIQRKMAQVESKRRKDLIRLWTVRGGKAGIILFGVLLVAKAVCFFMNLADCVLTIQ